MKNTIHFFLVISFLWLCTNIPAFAQEPDWIEQHYPYLRKVHSVNEPTKNDTIALIINHNGQYYVVKDDTVKYSGDFAFLKISSIDDNIDFNQHSFILKEQSKGLFYLEGRTTNFYYKNPPREKSSYKTQFWISDNKFVKKGECFSCKADEEGIYLENNNTRFISPTSDFKICKLYQGDYKAYIYKYNTQPQSIGTIEINTDEGYGTIYDDKPFIMPNGLVGYTVSEPNSETKDLTLNPTYKSGDIVPAQTALLVKGTKGNTYPYYAPKQNLDILSRTTTSSTDNLLCGTVTDALTTGPHESQSYLFYKLYYLTDTETQSKKLGFFWGAEGGQPFKNKAYKAYLALPQTMAPNIRGFVLPHDNVTDIKPIIQDKAHQKKGIYNLNGIKVNQNTTKGLPTGIYIIDGKTTYIQ